MNNSKKILFFYQDGRIDKINTQAEYAKEMFYGYHYFKTNDYDVEIIEFKKTKNLLNKIYFKIIEKPSRNLLKLPIYWSFITDMHIFKKLLKADFAIFSNNRVGFASLIILSFSNILNKKPKTLCFIMGLFSRSPKYKIFRPIQNILLIYFVKCMDHLIFLSESEYNYAKNNFKNYSYKMAIKPFAVDLDIWKVKKDLIKKRKILFVGNDGFRDFSFAKKLANSISNFEFVFVTNEIKKDELLNNSKVFNGSWANNSLSDIELANLYNESFITIIPLINSLQPSGQSVALQSIACGTPVIITETNGFWDWVNFKNNVNIFLAKNNSILYWTQLINDLDKNIPLYNEVRNNGIELIKKHYDLEDFSKYIEEILIG